MTSDDARRVTHVSSSNSDMETTFHRLRPDTSYNLTVAVSLRYGLATPVTVTAATTGKFLCRNYKINVRFYTDTPSPAALTI